MLTRVQKTDNDSVVPDSEDEDRFVLADYDSDNDKEDRKSLPGAANGEYISAANLALMEKSVDLHLEDSGRY